MSRYSRHIILSEIGQAGQDKISSAKVLVVGAGGLGCPILQYLSAAGIGTLGIIDFDLVEVSNLQRQVLFGTNSLGQNKAMAAKARLEDLNPTIKINAYPEKLTNRNALDLFEAYDIIVDGSDNFSTRYLVNDACIIMGKPVVYGAIYKFEGQVSVFNYKNGPTYRCMFPVPPKEGAIANCSEVGVLGVLPGIIGTLQANEVLKIILNIGDVLSGALWCFNTLTNRSITITFKKSHVEIEKVLHRQGNFQNESQEIDCDIIPEIKIEEALQKREVQFIDIRDYHEAPKIKELNPIQIPLNELKDNLDKIDKKKDVVCFCQTGMRSKQAVDILKAHHVKSMSLKGGALAIEAHYKTILNETN